MKFILLSLLTLSIFSCEEGEYVYLDSPPLQGQFSETFNILSLVKDKKIDILWVIDNSGSMSSIQSNIVKNTALFMQAFQANTHIEWKMGLISTDKNDGPYLGFNQAIPFDYTSPDPVSTFQSAVSSLGTMGAGSEYTFYNIDRMITTPLSSGQEDFTHFFRSDAHLVVIMVSDEKEQSYNLDSTKYLAANFYNHLRGLKDQEKVLRFYGAFDFSDMQGCSGTGWGTDKYIGSAFEEIIDQSAGFAISACTRSFGTELAKVGDDIVSLLKTPSIPLNARPKVETLEIIFKGERLKGGPRTTGGIWNYDREFSTINFYNLDFAGGDLKEADIEVRFEIDDGVDREEQE